MTNQTDLPKPVRRALNQIAHSRALLHEMECRARLDREIEELLASGKTPAEALEALRANPPTVDPQY